MVKSADCTSSHGRASAWATFWARVRFEMKQVVVSPAFPILMMWGDEIVGVEIPPAVELTVAETEPGIQGDRVSGARKPATLETGLVVQVPLFIGTGDKLRIDTRTGEYISKA